MRKKERGKEEGKRKEEGKVIGTNLLNHVHYLIRSKEGSDYRREGTREMKKAKRKKRRTIEGKEGEERSVCVVKLSY